MANIANFYKFYNLSRQYDGPLVLATTTDDIRQAKADGKLAVVLQFQGTHPIEYDASLVSCTGASVCESFSWPTTSAAQCAMDVKNPTTRA